MTTTVLLALACGTGDDRGAAGAGGRAAGDISAGDISAGDTSVGYRAEAFGLAGAVRLTVTPPLRVVAYVSMDRREVYVDRDFRDRASWLLNAHISVSTWHWRIPLPGDDPGIPITPGDEVREFEELDISLWDRSTPAMDDIRIVLADTIPGGITVGCVPIESDGDAEWLSARLTSPASVSSLTETIREDFHLLGSGELFTTSSCTGEGARSAPVVGWGQRPQG